MGNMVAKQQKVNCRQRNKACSWQHMPFSYKERRTMPYVSSATNYLYSQCMYAPSYLYFPNTMYYRNNQLISGTHGV
jgi:hypothetical protein